MSKHTPSLPPDALHQPFSWLPSHHQHDAYAQFSALTMDVCQGITTCIDLAHLSNTDRDDDNVPTLDIIATERLLHLAMRSSQMLGKIAAANIDDLSTAPRNDLNKPAP